MPAAEPLVSVIVPVRDGAHYLASCLGAVWADPCPPGSREVVVADNGSTDGSTELASSLGARVVLKPGVRVSALRNEAARHARGQLLAFIDVDHQIAPGWLSAALHVLSNTQVVAAGAPYRPPANPTWVQVMYDAMRDHQASPALVRWLGSGNLIVRRDTFEQVGGFDPDLEACEDVDLCRRLRQTGGQLVSTPDMVSRHLGDPATIGALFRGELWRGRDNLRVSLRGPITWHEMPSIIVPLLWLAVLALCLTVFLFRAGSLRGLAVVGVATLLVTAGLRATGMIRRASLRPGVQWLQAMVVALVYDAARGLSLLMRVTHRTRHQAGAR